MNKRLLTHVILLMAIVTNGFATVRVSNLSVEGRQDLPMGIDVTVPSLGWQISTDEPIYNLKQTRYHIMVASSAELLKQDKGDLWDETVSSNTSQWVKYAGKELKANQRCWWKVKVEYTYTTPLDLHTKALWTEWSPVSTWSVGLLTEGNWKGYWIGMDHANAWDVEDVHSRLSARYFRTSFTTAKTIRRATLHVCGLGLYEAYIDGKHVGGVDNSEANHLGETVMTPAPTDYRKSVIYNTYDVTDLISAAVQQQTVAEQKHCIAVTVSNGRFYTMQQNKKKHKITNFGYPCLRANLIIEYQDGKTETIATNEKNWKLNADGAIRSSNEYDGEIYDTHKEWNNAATAWTKADFDDSTWALAERSAIPQGTMVGNLTPSMKVLDTIQVKNIIKKDNSIITDFGQNYAGWTRINVGNAKLSDGDTLRISYAEKLGKDSTSLYRDNLRNALSTDYYISNGKSDGWWAPRFATHGGRYIEITILKKDGKEKRPALKAEDILAEVVSDDMRRTGHFECTDTMLNSLEKNAYWGILGNYKGMPVDCPQRDERMPWLGDRTMGCWGESYLLSNEALYYKWIKDIAEAQRGDGCIPDVAPAYWNYYSDNVTWPAVIVMASDMLYHQYGDRRAIEQFYPQMYKWMMHIWNDKRNSKTGLVKADKYGDWCVTPESPELIHSKDESRITDGTLIGSCYMYKLSEIMMDFGKVLLDENKDGKNTDMARRGLSREVLLADAQTFNEMHSALMKAINDNFLTIKEGTSPTKIYGTDATPEHMLYPDSIYYANNALTANLLPLAFGIVPDKYVKDITGQVLAKLMLNPANGRLCCGVIGVQWLLTELSKRGRTDVAYVLAARDIFPSWGYMVKQGATTIWELWNGDTANPAMNSGNHVMLLGDLVPWMYRDLGGISAAEPGYRKVKLAPRFELEEMSHAKVSYDTPYGKVVSNWDKTLDYLHWTVDVPCNTEAEIVMPHKRMLVGSGHYDFKEKLPLGDSVLANEFLYEKASFPSCHASTITELKNHDLLAAYFGGSYESCKDVCIFVQRKKFIKNDPKKGYIYEKGWSAPQMVADGVLNDTLRKACYNPVLYQIPNGDVILQYKIGKDVRDWTGYQMRSADNGYTWTGMRDSIPAHAGTEPDSLLGAIKNQPIMLPKGFRCKNGTVLTADRIIAPTSKETAPGSKTKPGQWRCYMEISEDGAKSWSLTAKVPQDDKIFRTIQPALLVHQDGRLQLLCRTAQPKNAELKDNACVATSWSDDGGLTWSQMEFVHDLPNNNSGIDAVTLPDGTFAVVYNPFGCVDWRGKKDPNYTKPLRNPLWIATSKDGIHWTPAIKLETSPVSQYSYPSMIIGSDGSLHCVYTWRRQRVKYQRIKF